MYDCTISILHLTLAAEVVSSVLVVAEPKILFLTFLWVLEHGRQGFLFSRPPRSFEDFKRRLALQKFAKQSWNNLGPIKPGLKLRSLVRRNQQTALGCIARPDTADLLHAFARAIKFGNWEHFCLWCPNFNVTVRRSFGPLNNIQWLLEKVNFCPVWLRLRGQTKPWPQYVQKGPYDNAPMERSMRTLRTGTLALAAAALLGEYE